MYQAYVGLSMIPYLDAAVSSILHEQNAIDIIFIALCGLFLASQFLLLKSIAKVFIGLFLFSFLIVEFMPQWDLNPQLTVNQIRLAGLFFLIPPVLTAICWKALK